MDQEERAYYETAVAHLEDAELAFEHGRYALAALMSALSAESATSALIVRLGSRPSKKHRNSLVLHLLSERAQQPLKRKLAALVKSMKKLEPHIAEARYPVRKGAEFLPPVKLYSEGVARELLEEARKVLSTVRELLGLAAQV